jgi:hypothetical protein
MDKQTQNIVLIGGGLALLYYLYTQGTFAGANAETPTEGAESETSTINAQLNAMNLAPTV